jgi:NADH-quinone oxidoreductase subunit G
VENSIDSELSGNIIDLCPVGALTNKPFRFSARAWELVARPSVAVHDGVGSNLNYHVRNGRVLRCVPRENEAVNESWLADRDRYSHFGLYSEDRVLHPQVKENGAWKTVSWDEAVATAAAALRATADQHGPEQLAALMSPSAATEEYFLAQSIVRQLGSHNIDHRLRERDFSDDAARPLSPAFTASLGEIGGCDSVLLIGCNPRQEAPIVGHRVRQAWRKGAAVAAINPVDWPFTFETSLDAIVAPQDMVGELAALAAAVEKVTGKAAPDFLRAALDRAESNDRQRQLAERLDASGAGVCLLGQFAMSHPSAAWLRALTSYIAEATGHAFNVLTHGGNANGAWLAGAVPHRGAGGQPHAGGRDAACMLETAHRAYVLWDIEPEHDCDNPGRAMQVLAEAGTVIAVASFATDSLRDIADVILPLAPAAESEGSIVNLDGTRLTFAAAGKAQGDARPGWKILRRLGGELGLQGFGQVSLAEVQADLLAAVENAQAAPSAATLADPAREGGLYRIGEVAMYSVDALCRRSRPLQETAQAVSGFVGLNTEDARRLGLSDGAMALLSQGEQQAELEVVVDDRVAAGGAWIRSATCASSTLGSAVAPITVAAAEVEEA